MCNVLTLVAESFGDCIYVYADLVSNELILVFYPCVPRHTANAMLLALLLSLSLRHHEIFYAYISKKKPIHILYTDINYSVFMLCVRITQVKTF